MRNIQVLKAERCKRLSVKRCKSVQHVTSLNMLQHKHLVAKNRLRYSRERAVRSLLIPTYYTPTVRSTVLRTGCEAQGRTGCHGHPLCRSSKAASTAAGLATAECLTYDGTHGFCEYLKWELLTTTSFANHAGRVSSRFSEQSSGVRVLAQYFVYGMIQSFPSNTCWKASARTGRSVGKKGTHFVHQLAVKIVKNIMISTSDSTFSALPK